MALDSLSVDLRSLSLTLLQSIIRFYASQQPRKFGKFVLPWGQQHIDFVYFLSWFLLHFYVVVVKDLFHYTFSTLKIYYGWEIEFNSRLDIKDEEENYIN